MDSFTDMIRQVDTKYNLGIGKSMGFNDVPQSENADTDSDSPIHSIFKLPVTYLSDEKIRPLSAIVSSDLEMVKNGDENVSKGMYDYLLHPQHDFAKNIIPDFNRYFTTDVDFLNESQEILHKFSDYKNNMKTPEEEEGEPYTFNQDKCQKIMEVWRDTKEDPDFLEKYCYIEWDMVKYLNKSPYFLQSLSIINMTAPIMSFIIPIVFLVFPFVILKIQKVPINFSMYIQVLKDIARHHFIGKAITSMQSLSWDKIIYMIITVALYGLQIYQNINLCYRFYRNIHKINSHLTDLRDYVFYSIQSMENFVEISRKHASYREFCEVTAKHCATLRDFYQELLPIRPFEPGFFKITEIGYLLKCFYELHSNKYYEDSLRYSMGFEGYINALSGIHSNLSEGHISMATFVSEQQDNADGNEVLPTSVEGNLKKPNMNNESTLFRKQYYPPYMGVEHVKNNLDLSNNAIITGPNASGKTTMLKATTINVIFSQQFGVGFYESCVLKPYTHIHSYLNIPDTSGRDSLFQAESRRCKEIIDIIQHPYDEEDGENFVQTGSLEFNTTPRHFCIFDELYSGTNPTEATKSAYAFLLYLSKYRNVDFILTTHYISICNKLEKKLSKMESLKQIVNYKMDVVENPQTGKAEYNYRMKRGISKIQGAVLILEDMCYPKEILDEMRKI